MSQTYYLYTDGGSRGNPGPASWAYVITDGQDTVKQSYGYLGVTTNNQAEYAGLINGLKALSKLSDAGEIVIKMDSELIVKQMQGLYKVKHPDLQPLYLQANDLVVALPKVQFTHIPRSQNAQADSLVNECLDSI